MRGRLIATDIATLGIRVDAGEVTRASGYLAALGKVGDDVAARMTAGTSRWNLGMVHLVQQQREVAVALERTRAVVAALDPYMARLGATSSSWAAGLNRLQREQVETAQTTAVLENRVRSMTTLMATANVQTGSWEAGLARMKAQQGAVAVASEGGEVSMGRFRNAIANLGLRAVGVEGPMGKVIETIALLGFGGVVVTSVLAGIAAIAAAMRYFGKEAREAHEAYEEWLKGLRNQTPLAIVGREMDAQRAKLNAMQASPLAGTQDMLTRINAQRAVVDALRVEYVKLQEALGAHSEQRQATAINDLAKGLAQLKQTFAGGFLDESGLERLQTLRAALADLRGNVTTVAARDTIDGLLQQADDYLRVQEKVAGLWTKISGGPIQQTLTDLERASQRVADIHKGIIEIGRAIPATENVGFTTQPQGNYTAQILLPAYQRELALLDGSHQQAKETAVAIGEAWDDTARSILGAAQAMGEMDAAALLLLHNAIAVGEAFDKLAKMQDATKKGLELTAGGLLGAIGAAAGLISSIVGLFGGGPSASEIESDRIRKENNQVLRELNKTIGDLGSKITGNEAVETQRATAAILQRLAGLPGGMAGGLRDVAISQGLGAAGISKQQLKDLADAYGITIDFQGTIGTFVASVQALNDAVKKTEIAQFAHTFTGQMDAVRRSFEIFNTTDPTAKLKEMLKVAGDVLYGIHGGTTGVGSPAIERAMRGLDLGSAAGRTQLLTNLQGLFTQMRQGALTPADLGNLTGQEFLDSLRSMIDLIRQAEEASKQNADALRATATMLQDFRKSLVLGPLTTLSPVQQLVEARRQYQDVLATAMTGDQAAAGRIPALAQAFLEASRAVNASGPAYAADFARVLAESNALAALFGSQADLLEQQLGIQQSIQSNTGQTVEQLQATVAVLSTGFQAAIDKLDALRVEMAENTRVTKAGLEGSLL